MMRPVDWSPGRALYQLHTLGAAGVPAVNPDVDADSPSGRGFEVLRGWVDHVATLGFGGALLTPAFVSSTHGYDTADPFRIDQRLGDEHDFGAFIDECHGRDLDVIVDGVFNHVGRAFGPFRDVLVRGRDSGFADWFQLDFSRDEGDGFGYRAFEGHRELVSLNHKNESVLEWASEVARVWLDRGADGWRLDAAYAIPVSFLRGFTERVRTHHPEAFLFGEVIHGDYGTFVAQGALDSVTQYELHKAIWSSLNDANFFELAWALKRHREFNASFAPVTFVGNHDVTRIASQLKNPAHLPLAVALLFTLPGIPSVYYGDEFALRGVKEDRAGGDDAIRPSLAKLAEAIAAESKPAEPEAPRQLHEQLIALRRDRPWLTRGYVEVGELINERISYTVTAPNEALLTVLDTTGSEVTEPAGWRAVVSAPGMVVCEPD
jgi:cyclomaltodextrinase